jgi:hypothetical protein
MTLPHFRQLLRSISCAALFRRVLVAISTPIFVVDMAGFRPPGGNLVTDRLVLVSITSGCHVTPRRPRSIIDE